MSSDRTPAARTPAWGIFRELEHSPGRETDDAMVLRAVAARLEDEGFAVTLKTSEEVASGESDPPPFLFVMCERPEILHTLERWEERGTYVVNRPEAVRNTNRHRTAALFARDAIPFPRSVLVSTAEREPIGPSGTTDLGGCWIKRGDAHKTQTSDVQRAGDSAAALDALRDLARRGIPRALLQEHVPGDLVKFYGLGGGTADPATGEPGWFEWFYHRDQALSRHPFDGEALAAIARRAAGALGLEVWGGDAVVGPDGVPVLIDLNAWPSFALYRDTAAPRIASWIASRFRQPASDRVRRTAERSPSSAASEA
ncbi:MAG: hypothetical protein ABI592_12380 [Acidobacteriota bacterium]